MDDWRYCPRCGAGLDREAAGVERHLRCPACGFVKYDNPLPATIGVVVRDRRVLLVRRAQEPHAGHWNTVGGFVSASESAEQAMRREAREEIGVDVVIERSLGSWSSVYGDTGLPTLGIGFLCRLADPHAEIRLSLEISAYEWFDAAELPELPFSDVSGAVRAWAQSLI
jgi:NADH pyrophosphatase NudC (nudix superfamily)